MKTTQIYRTPIVREQDRWRTLHWPQCTELSEAGCFNLLREEGDFAVVAVESEYDHRSFLTLPEFVDCKVLELDERERFMRLFRKMRSQRKPRFPPVQLLALPDDFNRASLGTDWSTISGCGALSIKSSIKCMADGDPEGSYYNATSPAGANYYSQITLLATITTSSGKGMGPAVRVNSGTAGNMYFVQCNAVAAERMQMWEVTGGGGTYTNIAGSTAVTPAAGDTARLTINSTTLTFALNGTDRISQVDNTLTATGTWGIFGASASEDYCDDFAPGDVGAATGQPTIKRFGGIPYAASLTPRGSSGMAVWMERIRQKLRMYEGVPSGCLCF